MINEDDFTSNDSSSRRFALVLDFLCGSNDLSLLHTPTSDFYLEIESYHTSYHPHVPLEFQTDNGRITSRSLNDCICEIILLSKVKMAVKEF